MDVDSGTLLDDNYEEKESCVAIHSSCGSGKWSDLRVEEPSLSEPTPPELFDLEPSEVTNYETIPSTDVESQLYILNRLPITKDQKVDLLVEEGVPRDLAVKLVKP
jgi:hypothetical protein